MKMKGPTAYFLRLLQLVFGTVLWLPFGVPLAVFFLIWLVCRLLVWIRFGNSRLQMTGDEAGFMHESDIDKAAASGFLVFEGPYDPNRAEEIIRKFVGLQKQVPFFRLTCIPEKIHG